MYRQLVMTTKPTNSILPLRSSGTLLITQRITPHQGVAARRLAWLVGELARRGPVFIISSRAPEGAELPGVTRRIVVGAKDLRTISLGSSSRLLPVRYKSNPLFRGLLKLRQSFPFLYLTDDGGLLWRKRATMAAKQLLQEAPIDTIISSFRPWSDHLVAREVKAQHPRLRWVADFRDLPVDQVRKDVWWPGLQRWWGKRIIRIADEVWTVSRGQGNELRHWHPNIRIVRNPLLSLPPVDNTPHTAQFTLVYTGSLYPGLQSIVPLVKSLRAILEEGTILPDQLRLCYRGKDAELFRKWTTDFPTVSLDIGSIIAPAAAQKMQKEAQVLLLLNWSAEKYEGVLTAKLWDYLASGRPVLGLINGPADEELREVIEGAAAGAVFATNEQGLTDWLRRAIERWRQDGTLPHRTDRSLLRPYLYPLGMVEESGGKNLFEHPEGDEVHR